METSARWWRPAEFKGRFEVLQGRTRIKQAARHALLDRDFTEVETSILQISPGNETHVSAFGTEVIAPDEGRHPLFLHTSPEFACKKLLSAGLSRLFTLAPVFRNRERTRLHHPEFLMLEWYRANDPLHSLMDDCMVLLRESAAAAGTGRLRHRGIEIDPLLDPSVITVVEAFRQHAGIDLQAVLPGTPRAIERIAEEARTLGLRVSADDTWSDIFSKILSVWVEPNLGIDRPTFLTRYPATEAALACLCEDDTRFAERFELYCCGVELANAFGELRDPLEQRRRFIAAEAERERIYGETYPIDEDFLEALEIMPASVGIALGFDRLVMLTMGRDSIDDVLWMPMGKVGS